MRARVSYSTVVVFILFLVLSLIHAEAEAETRLPHIIYIMVDDVGWANVGFHNPRMITPHLDNLRADSINLQHFYVYKACSPTRASFLSGRLPYHVNEFNGNSCVPGRGMPANMTALPEKLTKGAGYVTHQIGKWHLGYSSESLTPYGQGFSTSLGYLSGAEDHWTQYRNQTVVTGNSTRTNCGGVDLWETRAPAYNKNGTYGGYIWQTRATEILTSMNHSKPMFMYLALQNNHAPYEVPQSYIDKFNASWYPPQRVVAGMSNFLDETIGNLAKIMKATGIWDNLLLVIAGDNGGPSGTDGSVGNNSPLRGGKYSDFEGGVRVFGMLSGGLVPPHRRGINLNGTIHVADWYSTFCELAGVDPMDDQAFELGLPPIDSINMWPFLMGKTQASPRSQFILSSALSHQGGGGIYRFPYKLIFGSQQPAFWTTLDYPNGTAGSPKQLYCGSALTAGGGCMFNIQDDPTEHHDIVNDTRNKALVEDLRHDFLRLNATTFFPDRGAPDPRCCDAIEKNDGYWGPWLNKPWAPMAGI